jgi:hypothetical protein
MVWLSWGLELQVLYIGGLELLLYQQMFIKLRMAKPRIRKMITTFLNQIKVKLLQQLQV